MDWWHWKRAETALETWVRALIGDRPYPLAFSTGAGSYVNFRTREIVVEPNLPDALGGARLLPMIWRGRRVTMLAALQWRCARALARHEAAHILFTQPSEADRGGVHHWLINALEDGRIERYLGARAPWCWADFVELGRLIHQQYTLPAEHEERLLSACLLHRWDVLRPKRTLARVTFPDPDGHRLWESEIRPLVEAAWLATDAERVTEIASEILRRIGVPETARSSGLRNPLDAAPIGERAAGDAPLAVESDTAARVMTLDTSMTVMEETSLEGADPPGVDLDPSGGQLLMEPYRAIEREVAGQLRRIVKALVPPTPNVAPRPHLVSGSFSVREQIRSQGERPMLRARGRARDPKGLAVVLLIDRTGSMGNRAFTHDGQPAEGFFSASERMYHARRAALLLDRACAAARIPLCIGYAGNEVSPAHGPLRGRRLHLPQSVVWIRDWQTPLDAEGPLAVLAGMYGDAGNAERVSESLRLAQARLGERREGTRLIVYIHDGEPTDERPDAVRRTVKDVRRTGLIILGLFVGDQRELPKLEAIFGSEHTIGVADLKKLPERLGTILTRYYHH
jgi:hypothetical protein